MMPSVNSKLDEPIYEFFSKTGTCTTRTQCDGFAREAFGGPVEPVAAQGVCSYTVGAANDTVIVQFREPESPLDMEMLETVQTVHPEFVAACRFHGTIGSVPALLVYSMNMLPGDNYLDISLCLPDDDLDHQLATVRSLARFVTAYFSPRTSKAAVGLCRNMALLTRWAYRFFAESWQKRCRPEASAVSADLEDCSSSFDYLSRSLPSRFQNAVARVQKKLPALFSGEYPLVLTHGDLSERNILVNPETGEITGIIDWAEAGIRPFGFALYALDSIVGYLTPDRWVFHESAEHLRSEFWSVFCQLVGGVSPREMELIQLARLAGLFLRYGIPYKPGRKGVVGIGNAKDTAFRILDALITDQKSRPPGPGIDDAVAEHPKLQKQEADAADENRCDGTGSS
jgi:hypothetical protein